ncbi:MAG TPA: isocitrate lyase/phosphoenolpyruvate mutase family protein [Terriglobales bacterium]|nr:isocitrate lyase/phosphoenolpyruvate mutase family protein [Terriglobales bacterium]
MAQEIAKSESLQEKAETLLSLHRGSKILVLINAWDVASARLVEHLGFPAVATSSAAVANSLGYPDGERISRNEMLNVVERITSAVHVPVTADMEAGYARDPEQMADTARELIEAGAVGLNLEDSLENESRLVDVKLQVEKIKAVRSIAEIAHVPLVLNARTDAYWWKGADPKTRLAETMRRANIYREAGGDCIFVPGLVDKDEISRLLKESPGPLNILGSMPGAPSIRELQELGVARVSLGAGPYRTALGAFRRLAHELLESGTYRMLAETAIPSPEMKRLLE